MGGAEVLAARLAHRLGTAYRFVFVCLDDLGSLGEQLRADGFPVHVLSRRAGVDCGLVYRLARVLRREQIDLVQAHQYTPFFYALAARLLYRRPPILFTEHGRAFPDYPRRKRIFANRLLLERRDRVVAVGKAVRQALIDNEGIPAERVTVIYNGVDVEALAKHRQERETVRRELAIDPEDLVLIQVARLDPLKDHGTAVRAMKKLVERRAQARLLLVGEGPERTGIEQAIRDGDLRANVLLLGLRTDVARLLSAADLFLLTSVSEGIPVTLIEAMAAGLPVISTSVGGVPEVVEDGTTGLLSPVGDPTCLAEQILRLAEDPPLRKCLGERGLARAGELFSETQMHKGYVQLYEEMLGQVFSR
jgi:glycosyltransferase involved in cell wall biosynthesis